ncbi:MAG: DUF6476 family protein [Pararhodobacter sp.]
MRPPPDPTPPDLRFLKLLVSSLAGVMIIGLVTIVALLVIRLGAAPAPLALPANIALPEGARMQAVTLAPDWVAVVTEDGEILLYDRISGALRNRLRPE